MQDEGEGQGDTIDYLLLSKGKETHWFKAFKETSFGLFGQNYAKPVMTYNSHEGEAGLLGRLGLHTEMFQNKRGW